MQGRSKGRREQQGWRHGREGRRQGLEQGRKGGKVQRRGLQRLPCVQPHDAALRLRLQGREIPGAAAAAPRALAPGEPAAPHELAAEGA